MNGIFKIRHAAMHLFQQQAYRSDDKLVLPFGLIQEGTGGGGPNSPLKHVVFC